ncbi:type II pantothenate kinase [Oceanobacillus halotolerans]|uniref:type II pantothenate kinase n=1 Tax=Oceanobacillus halotolerans TaxID=2663380 RepID=UPI0013DB4312|nr:type II pantothenate kinase [Oceanobacillus halotolerans]
MKQIGIDAGGSLTKLAYMEQGTLHTKTYSNTEMDAMIQWLAITASNAELLLTGGRREEVGERTSLPVKYMDEFQALVEGTRYLLQTERNWKEVDPYLLVSIGTGTSMFAVQSNSYERVLGSGIGGGTFMGLGHLLTGERTFSNLVQLANKGDQKQSDLLVKDIYTGNTDTPILGELTAANLGKAHLNDHATKEDHMASVVQLIGESLLTLATQVAVSHNMKSLVFIGSTLNGNTPLKTVLESFQEMLPYDPIFLDKGSHAGAIGALLAKE